MYLTCEMNRWCCELLIARRLRSTIDIAIPVLTFKGNDTDYFKMYYRSRLQTLEIVYY